MDNKIDTLDAKQQADVANAIHHEVMESFSKTDRGDGTKYKARFLAIAKREGFEQPEEAEDLMEILN